MRESGWMRKIFHSSSSMEPDLKSKRVANPASGTLMKHSAAGHRGDIEELTWPNGQEFGRGELFPKHVTPGDITKIEKFVLQEYQKYMHRQSSQITSFQDAGGSHRIVVWLGKYGVDKVGAFIRNGSICSVFPEKD
jgi:hypothetical protein